MRAVEADVAVIGGGPAGSSLATLLRQQGYRVTLLERETFPRPHVGESMLPGVLFALAKTGALERVEKAGFTRKYGATYIWGRSRDPWTIRFSEISQDRTFTFQCDREVFDKLLLDHARDEGVDVREGHQVTRALMSDGRVTGLAFTDGDGTRAKSAPGCAWTLRGSGRCWGVSSDYESTTRICGTWRCLGTTTAGRRRCRTC